MKKIGLKPAQVWAAIMSCYEKARGNSHLAYNAMMHDFRRGERLPSVGNWKSLWRREHPGKPMPHFCPLAWVPRGASYAAIMAAKRECK